MAKLQRYLQKIFANNSNQVGVFGTGTDKETSKNVETLQSADYENGWSSAIITNKNYPIWQERDGVDYGFSYQLAYLMQAGMPEWLSTETYYTNSYCRYGSDIYYSLQDDNTNHNPALNDGWWTLYGGANTNLSNLTATGKTKVVTLAYELDFTNAVTVSTTSSVNWVSYTATADGMLFAETTGSNQSLYARIMYDGTTYTVGATVSSGSSVGTCFPMVNGQTVKYQVYGGTNRYVTFVPFKKS